MGDSNPRPLAPEASALSYRCGLLLYFFPSTVFGQVEPDKRVIVFYQRRVILFLYYSNLFMINVGVPDRGNHQETERRFQTETAHHFQVYCHIHRDKPNLQRHLRAPFRLEIRREERY